MIFGKTVEKAWEDKIAKNIAKFRKIIPQKKFLFIPRKAKDTGQIVWLSYVWVITLFSGISTVRGKEYYTERLRAKQRSVHYYADSNSYLYVDDVYKDIIKQLVYSEGA